MIKYITDYLKEHGEFHYNSECNGDFTLKLCKDYILFKFDTWCDGCEMSVRISTKQKPAYIEDIIMDTLERFEREIRFCSHCGKPIDSGFTVDDGNWYCCEDCFEDDMNEDYGKGKWRRTDTGYCYYAYYDENFKEWCNTHIYYTEWC